jgi:copper oxidase (laccase) domain-containing protein
MTQSPALSALPNIRHAFFTREGGVSGGVYQSLNGGLGSRDTPAVLPYIRRRMAAALGAEPEQLITAYQIHSPDVVVAEHAWTRETAPRADAVVTQVPGLAIGVTTADCGPVLFAVAARLDRAGIAAIDDLALCTYAEPDRFFSYRRATHRADPDYGRHVNAIVLVD